MANRIAAGMTEWQARIGRTTIYDAFRSGRQNIDSQLIGELVQALGESDDEAKRWMARCDAVRASMSARAPRHRVDLPSAPLQPALAPRLRVALLVVCVAINLGGRLLVNGTHMPLYLDMIGTAIAAIIVGPWQGAAVGVLTSVIGVSSSGWVSLPFVPVEVAGALIWGYGVRRFKFGSTVPRYFLLNVIVALVCSVIAVPTIVWLEHGITGNGADHITHTMNLFWHNLFSAVLSQNLMTSLADKLISGFIALGVAESLPVGRPGSSLKLSSSWLQSRSAA
jgi:energy-coupling factor transport system substrate-specific component